MQKKYRARIIDKILDFRLKSSGAVQIKGAKWCGKTSTAERQAKSALYMSDSEKMEQNINLAKMSPKDILSGETPRLIDEWQLVPTLWDAVRFEVDHRNKLSQFILTGSATPADTSQINHSGVGRITSILMRPMSLYESGESSGEISLAELFESPKRITGLANLDLNKLAYATCRGGWPQATQIKDKEIALAQAENYFSGLIQSDISKVDGVKRDPALAARIMRSYARFQGEQASLEKIREDANASGNSSLSIDTIRSYINALQQIYIVEDAPSWNANLRSKSAIRTSDTRYFVDPSLATEALGVSPKGLVEDLNTFGFIFETLCIRDLRIYAESIGGKVSHYRDSSGLECDAVVHLKDGRYGLIQIKLGANEEPVRQGIIKLQELYSSLDFTKMREPSFMMVLTGNGKYAYRDTGSGVYIIPVGCLKN